MEFVKYDVVVMAIAFIKGRIEAEIHMVLRNVQLIHFLFEGVKIDEKGCDIQDGLSGVILNELKGNIWFASAFVGLFVLKSTYSLLNIYQ